ncbi:glycosyltransferase [bacterium]|nr:glycosyltransferase [bacterium]
MTIAEKIENSLNIDYPKDKIEIIIIDSSSTDKTAEIVKSYENR